MNIEIQIMPLYKYYFYTEDNKCILKIDTIHLKKTRKVHGSIRHKKVGGQDIHIKKMQGGGGEPLKWDDKGLRGKKQHPQTKHGLGKKLRRLEM